MKPSNKSQFIASVSALISLTALDSVPALAGEGGRGDHNGNGGIGMICRNSDGSLSSVKPVDLAEAGGVVKESAEAAETQIASALAYLSRAGFSMQAFLIDDQIKHLKAHRITPEEGYSLDYRDDAHDRLRSESGSCGHEQIAIYYPETRELKVDPVLYARLSNTGKAAFWLHEGIYALASHRNGANDSIKVRALVRELLLQKARHERLKELMPFNTLLSDDTYRRERSAQELPSVPVRCDDDCDFEDFLGKYVKVDGADRCVGELMAVTRTVLSGVPVVSLASIEEPEFEQVHAIGGIDAPYVTNADHGNIDGWRAWPSRSFHRVTPIDNGIKMDVRTESWSTKIARTLGRAPRVFYGQEHLLTVRADGDIEYKQPSRGNGQDSTCVYRRTSR